LASCGGFPKYEHLIEASILSSRSAYKADHGKNLVGRIKLVTAQKNGFCGSLFSAAINRRKFLTHSAQIAGGAMLAAPALGVRVFAADEPIAEINAGKIRGVTIDGVNAFKGVPYGAPTGGRDRFMPPKKPEPWAGVRSAQAWAGHAPQSPPDRKQRPELAGLGGVRDTVPESEDCLTLNVWTRGLDDASMSSAPALPDWANAEPPISARCRWPRILSRWLTVTTTTS
jgi:Carboxylesterase family